MIGVTRMPPRAPSAADMAKLMNSTQGVDADQFGGQAIDRSGEHGLAGQVRLKKYQRATTTRAVTPKTQRLCGRSVAPGSRSGIARRAAGCGCSCPARPGRGRG